ncbi:MAG TPA: DUF423 domain-containing protein [Bacteroidia bacterium]|jgi:uncharacterized membrane protein YgdD (TMEM256/DUF423 family)|nr:DUF423 domain-containing protein [Bacteroidia bacterium]
MKNTFSFIAGLFGTTGVALGALGAHALKQKMQEGILSIDQLSAFDTGTKYQLMHAIVLFILAYVNRDKKIKLYTIASYLMVFGVLFFSGSIYMLSTQNISGIHAGFIFGPITPLGGLLLISGWLCITIQALKPNES